MIFFFQILFVSSAFHDPFAAGFPVLQNQGWIHLLNKSLQRLPPYAESRVRSAVWQSSLCPTGIAMHFRSNATSFAIVGTLVGQIVYPNIPQTGAAGVELYARHTDGKWYSCFDRCSYGAEVKCNYENLLPATREYRMYVSSLVQVKDFKFAASGTNYFLEWLPTDTRKPIVVYGTASTQGVAAGRLVAVWPTIVHRTLDRPVLNFGFSGQGKLEPEVVELIAENDAALYTLDCLTELAYYSKDAIKTLIIYAVGIIRKTRPNTPILLVDHPGYGNEFMNVDNKNLAAKANSANQEAYEELKKAGDNNVHRLTREEIGFDDDCFQDYVHPNSWGFEVLAQAHIRKIIALGV